MFNFFPFSNNHQLNLDWILEQLVKMPLTVNNTHPDPGTRNINLPTVAGMSSWNGIGADGAGNVDPVEIIADLNLPDTGFHIYAWENPTTAHNPYGASENHGYMTGAGGGLCFSSYTAGDYAVQLAVNMGCDAVAFRHKESGNPWSSWVYSVPGILDVSSYVTLGIPSCINQLQPYNVKAVINNGIASIYIEGQTTGAAGLNDFIAGGLPVPDDPGTGLGYITGIIQDSQTTELKPCRFLVDGSGDLRFSYLGDAANPGDVLVIRGEYPVAL